MAAMIRALRMAWFPSEAEPARFEATGRDYLSCADSHLTGPVRYSSGARLLVIVRADSRHAYVAAFNRPSPGECQSFRAVVALRRSRESGPDRYGEDLSRRYSRAARAGVVSAGSAVQVPRQGCTVGFRSPMPGAVS